MTMRNVFAVPDNQFDSDKFLRRYGLREEEFQVVTLDSQMYVTVEEAARRKITDDPPVFEAPQRFKTQAEYAAELVAQIQALPIGTAQERRALTDTLMKFAGVFPPERIPEPLPEPPPELLKV